ncbi:MAG TPA: 2'-5' RNA ligase family protein [Caulobacteraceae bacterium]
MQRSLDWRDSPQRPPAAGDLFFGLLLDAEPADQALARGRLIAEGMGFGGRFMHGRRLHISLQSVPPSRWDGESAVAAACRAGARVAMAPFWVSLDGVATFNSGKEENALVLTTSSPEVRELYGRLREALIQERLPPGRPDFNPHVTLKRGPGFVAEMPAVGLGWTAREFVLIRSFRGQGRYEIPGRWRLQGRATPRPGS